MIIKIDDFKLVPQESGWDLIRTVKAQKVGTGTMQNPNGEIYERDIDLGYNMRLESAIADLIHIKLSENNTVVTLQEFLKAYKEEKSKIDNILNNEQLM